MIVPDVNLLLYATVDAFPEHPVARDWWQSVLSGTSPIGLTAPAVLGFVRISTHRRVLTQPMGLAEARRTVDGWLAQPFATFLRPARDHLSRVLDLLQRVGAAGNLTTDAQIAAIALEHGGTVYSADVDFGRFDGLDWQNPLAG